MQVRQQKRTCSTRGLFFYSPVLTGNSHGVAAHAHVDSPRLLRLLRRSRCHPLLSLSVPSSRRPQLCPSSQLHLVERRPRTRYMSSAFCKCSCCTCARTFLSVTQSLGKWTGRGRRTSVTASSTPRQRMRRNGSCSWSRPPPWWQPPRPPTCDMRTTKKGFVKGSGSFHVVKGCTHGSLSTLQSPVISIA